MTASACCWHRLGGAGRILALVDEHRLNVRPYISSTPSMYSPASPSGQMARQTSGLAVKANDSPVSAASQS